MRIVEAAVDAHRRLDDVRDDVLAAGLIEVAERFAGVLLVLLEVVVATVGDALDLGETGEREVVLDVDGALRIVRELLRRVFAQLQVLLADAEVVGPPVHAGLDPAVVPLLVAAGHDEELHLHLLELTVAEDEVARRDLVAERAADLGDAEGQLLAHRRQHVVEVDEHALGCLRPQVGDGGVVGDGADERLEHQIEHPRIG